MAEKEREKDVEGYPFVITINWLRTKTSFEILKSLNTSISGSRQPFCRNEVVERDFKVHCTTADLLFFLFLTFAVLEKFFTKKKNQEIDSQIPNHGNCSWHFKTSHSEYYCSRKDVFSEHSYLLNSSIVIICKYIFKKHVVFWHI